MLTRHREGNLDGLMKAARFSIILTLLMAGCGESDLENAVALKHVSVDAVGWSSLQDRNGVAYLPNASQPFSGCARLPYDNGQVELLAQFEGGFVVRLKQWSENGIPKWNIGYKQGKVRFIDVPFDRLLESNSSNHEGFLTEWYANGGKKSKTFWKNGMEEGVKLSWYEGGSRSRKRNFHKGKKDGLSTWWYENGQKKSETYWKNGEAHGLKTSWHDNGNRSYKGYFEQGSKNGLETYYRRNGHIWRECSYKSGKREGLATEWYENGQRKSEVFWKDGKEDGTKTFWYENGHRHYRVNLKDGKEDGLQTYYRRNGQIWREYSHKSGRREGLATEWYENGQKRTKANMKSGRLISAIAWKPNGEKCPLTRVNEGDGVLVGYNEDGTESERISYKEGEQVAGAINNSE